MARVVELITYPIKGCAGVSLTEAPLTEAGLPHDRGFMVINEDGVFRSQRRDPGLALISPRVGPDGERLTLSAPGAGDLSIGIDTVSARREVLLFGSPYQGIDQGDEAAGWLSDVLGVACRLVRVPPEHDRVADGLTPGTSGYADSNAVHIISRASLDELNRRITGDGGEPLPMARFRPNVVVDGWTEPHTEDRARHLTIGDTELGFAKTAARCVVTMVDQDKGAKAGPEPLRTLARYRRAPEGGGTLFGAKFSVTRTGTMAVGDEVAVGSWDGPPPAE
ncbi:MOSC N-terminal beta barrel domain-containing protein [Streptomyces sp. NA02950]|uniref:MOSC domain-containing protein n=1 Tax=Streptomyces sp. NA02950 TaxID=2742137 RepID=UPI00159120C7|nr:MOSC N-terminal beta barrel domain-containing protein [Streptomyces sp. NA02950]QKV96803.1 MOSC N-terminal beta barrel domain-containing protein [Streptomyces sp. NA02950]